MERWMQEEVVPLIEKALGEPIGQVNPMKVCKPLASFAAE